MREGFFYDSIKDIKVFYSLVFVLLLASCGGPSDNNNQDETATNQQQGSPAMQAEPAETKPANPMDDKGIGPVKSVEVGEINADLILKGQALFEANCTACHKLDKRYVGPALEGVTKRRAPEWIMNMILNPTEMTQNDPIAKGLIAEYVAPMANQNLTQEEARAILEFFRGHDASMKPE